MLSCPSKGRKDIYTKHITDVILMETNPTTSRAEDLCPLAWLCANCMHACLPFPPLGCPVPTTGRHYKTEVCMKAVWSTFVKIIESYDTYLFFILFSGGGNDRPVKYQPTLQQL